MVGKSDRSTLVVDVAVAVRVPTEVQKGKSPLDNPVFILEPDSIYTVNDSEFKGKAFKVSPKLPIIGILFIPVQATLIERLERDPDYIGNKLVPKVIRSTPTPVRCEEAK